METPKQHYGTPSPIDRLPTEMIIEVFRYYVASDISPWRLTFICNRWRQIALSTPDLWTHIIVDAIPYIYDDKWSFFGISKRTRGRAAVCLNADEFRDAVSMAGSLPLHVEFIFGFVGNPEAWREILIPLINEVFCSAITHRIFDLHFSSVTLNMELVMSTSLCNDTQFLPLSNLRVLRVSTMYIGPSMDRLLNSIYSSSKASLRRLELESRHDDAQIDSIVTGFVKLEEFNIHDWPVTAAPPITLCNLTSLNLRCPAIHFGRVHLPLLRTLIIEDRPVQPPSNGEFRSSILPNLHTLTAKIQTTEWLKHLVAPSLRVLSITGVDLPSAQNLHVNLLSPNLFPAVEQFTFILSDKNITGDLDSQDSVLISALHAVPNVISVRMQAHSLVYNEGKLRMALLDRLATENEEELLCSRLRDLEMKCTTWRGNVPRGGLKDDEASLIQRVVEVRKKMGRELNSFVVRTTCGWPEVIHRCV